MFHASVLAVSQYRKNQFKLHSSFIIIMSTMGNLSSYVSLELNLDGKHGARLHEQSMQPYISHVNKTFAPQWIKTIAKSRSYCVVRVLSHRVTLSRLHLLIFPATYVKRAKCVC